MKYLLAVSVIAMLSAPAYAGKKIDKTLEVDPTGKVEISVVRTDIDVEVWDKSEVRVTGELDDATEKFIFETSGSKTIIKIELDDGLFHGNWHSSNGELSIFVPKGSTVESGGVSGDLNVTGVLGGVSLHTVSGDIDLKDVADFIEVETVSGDVEVQDCTGKMKLASVSGDITANGNASHFDANTVSGDVNAEIGLSERVDLSTVSGDVEIEFELATDGRVDAETVSGDVALHFDNDVVNARFDIDTGPGGDIENSITDDRSDSSFIGAEKIKFRSGDGKGTVEINTMSGSIEVEN